MQQLQHLLDKLELIRVRQESQKPKDSFNVFRLLRPEHDEVNLHSRFIHELLNPKGSHGMGDAFLRLFAEVCNAATDIPCFPALSYDTVQVLREHANIDILIQDKLHAIVIENKIYAKDQHEQLKRYHDFAIRSLRTPTLFYLTLDGNPPSDWSTGELQTEVKCIAYSQEIDSWLSACIKEAATQPTIRETIIQYQQLIHQLTGKNVGEKEELIDLIKIGNNAKQAAIIARNWVHVRWHTEWDFWNELLAVVENSYDVSPNGKFSEEALTKVIHGRRDRKPWYGLSFRIGQLNGVDLNLRIERNEGPMYYGLPYCSHDADIRSRMLNAVQHLVTQQTQSWAGLKTTDCGIDLETFSNTVTLQLANPERRKQIIDELWKEIQIFISESIKSLLKEFGSNFLPANCK